MQANDFRGCRGVGFRAIFCLKPYGAYGFRVEGFLGFRVLGLRSLRFRPLGFGSRI